MANVTYDDVDTRGDFVRNSSWGRFADFDSSADKTVRTTTPPTAARSTTWRATSPPKRLRRPDDAGRDGRSRRPTCARLPVAMVRLRAAHGPLRRLVRATTSASRRSSPPSTASPTSLDAWVSYNYDDRQQTLNDINYGTDFTSGIRLRNTATATTCSATDTTASSVKVDAGHNVTGYTLGNCLNTASAGGNLGFGISARDFSLETTSDYVSFGANYKGDRLQVEFHGLGRRHRQHDANQQRQRQLRHPRHDRDPGSATGKPSFKFASGYSPSDASAIRQWQIQYRPSLVNQKKSSTSSTSTTTPTCRSSTRWSSAAAPPTTRPKATATAASSWTAAPTSIDHRRHGDLQQRGQLDGDDQQRRGRRRPDQPGRSARPTPPATGVRRKSGRGLLQPDVRQRHVAPASDFYYGGGSIPSNWNYPNFDKSFRRTSTRRTST
jgi:iron complex outermembrane receptor protein